MNDSFASMNDSSSPVKATVKWFNPSKGFGFVVDPNGGKDVFLHISAVSNAGYERLPDGTTITCTIGDGPKGSEIKQILAVDTSTAVEKPRAPRRDGGFGGGDREYRPRRDFDDHHGGGHHGHAPSGPAQEITGTVKWYNSKKGFGFVMPENGGRDIFLHMSALRRSGLRGLDEGQTVRMRVVNGPKGLEADTVEIV